MPTYSFLIISQMNARAGSLLNWSYLGDNCFSTIFQMFLLELEQIIKIKNTMRGHPMARQPYHHHYHSLSSDNLHSLQNHITSSLQTPSISNHQTSKRTNSNHKETNSNIQNQMFKQWDQKIQPTNAQQKKSKHQCKTKITEESLSMQGSINDKEKDRIGNNYERLGDKAGNAQSIEIGLHNEYENPLRDRNENINKEKHDKKKVKRSGYGVVENPCPQYLQPGQLVDFSNLFNIGRCWSRFQGSFVNGNKSGPGNIYLTNGILFSGYFQKDVANGKGAIYIDGDLKIKGFWKNNKLVTKF